MRLSRLLFVTLMALLCGSLLRAQSGVPVASGSITAQTLEPGGAAVTFDLRNVFTVPGVTGPIAQFDTVFGKFNVELLPTAAPQHVANFLGYAQAGAYTNSVIHRAAELDVGGVSIIQGGGFRLPITNGGLPSIAANAPVPLEYNLPNERGTLAAARTADINSATNQWFFNTRDNSTILGPTNNSGYTVFGRVIGTGMSVVDAIAALQRVNAGGNFSELPVRNFAGGNILDANLVAVNAVTSVPLYPSISGGSVLTFSVETSNATVINAAIQGTMLALVPGTASGSATVTVHATDTNGNSATTVIAVTVVGGPQFSTQPVSQSVSEGGTVILTAAATPGASYQWRRNGSDVAGATGSTLTLSDLHSVNAGVYTVVATDASGSATSQGAVIGIDSSSRVIGDGYVIGSQIHHQNGNVYDQVLLTGPAATITPPQNQVVRLSYIDLNDDIVQVEFAGKGSLTITLDTPTGPAAPLHYNQPSVSYWKGHATLVISGADETTNVLVFSVGRATAFDPTGAYNLLLPISTTNDPANNGSTLFQNHPVAEYDGMADIALIAIASTNGKFGGVRTANTSYFSTHGFTGVYAPGVAFTGPLFVGDISAEADSAIGTLITGAVADVRITGGDLQQTNGRAVQVDGMTQIQMAAGTNSQGTFQSPQAIRGRLERNGVDVTSQLVSP